MNPVTFLGQIRKPFGAVVAGAIGWAQLVIASPSAQITAPEWVMGATILAGAFGVYALTNDPKPPAVVVPPAPVVEPLQ